VRCFTTIGTDTGSLRLPVPVPVRDRRWHWQCRRATGTVWQWNLKRIIAYQCGGGCTGMPQASSWTASLSTTKIEGPVALPLAST